MCVSRSGGWMDGYIIRRTWRIFIYKSSHAFSNLQVLVVYPVAKMGSLHTDRQRHVGVVNKPSKTEKKESCADVDTVFFSRNWLTFWRFEGFIKKLWFNFSKNMYQIWNDHRHLFKQKSVSDHDFLLDKNVHQHHHHCWSNKTQN